MRLDQEIGRIKTGMKNEESFIDEVRAENEDMRRQLKEIESEKDLMNNQEGDTGGDESAGMDAVQDLVKMCEAVTQLSESFNQLSMEADMMIGDDQKEGGKPKKKALIKMRENPEIGKNMMIQPNASSSLVKMLKKEQ